MTFGKNIQDSRIEFTFFSFLFSCRFAFFQLFVFQTGHRK